MALGLTDPLTALSFSAMATSELTEHHRRLVAAQREVDHWRRLIRARLDLAVASVADVDELIAPETVNYGISCPPPSGLRDLLGIPRQGTRMREARLLLQLRSALIELTSYAESLNALTQEAAHVLTFRAGIVALSAR